MTQLSRQIADALLDKPDVTPREPAAWGRVEIMGHREHSALLSSEPRLGIQGLRVYIACDVDGAPVLNLWYTGAAIFSIEFNPDAEEVGRRWARDQLVPNGYRLAAALAVLR